MSAMPAAGRPAEAPHAALRRRLLWPYVLTCLAAATVCAVASGLDLVGDEVLVFALLIGAVLVLDATGTELLGGGHATPTTVPSLALALLFGPAGAFLGESALALKRSALRKPVIRNLFDLGALGLAGAAAWAAARSLPHDGAGMLLTGLVAGGVFYAVNSLLLLGVWSLREGRSPLALWRQRLSGGVTHELAYGPIAGLLVLAVRDMGPLALALVAAPVLVIWLSQRLAMSTRIGTERELQSTRDYLSAVTASMADGLCAVDTKGCITYVNPAAERLLGWTAADLVGRQLHETTHGQHPDGSPYPATECPLVRARRHSEAIRVEDDVFFAKDGSQVAVAYTSAPIELRDGVHGAVIVFTDIGERKREQARVARDIEALNWLARIKDALTDDRFVLHAQPIIDLASRKTVQHELLIRMLDEDGKLVPPGLFLPVAERYGVIREIDRWVIRQAAQIAASGHAIELNISAESLGDEDLAAVVERELHDAGADPRLVVIELTETALIGNEELAGAFLTRVGELGCGLALDDFGTGYGGFSYVKRLPVDSLKIDIEFVRDLVQDRASQHVVRAIVQLAKDFGHHTVAEGVEDDATLAMLSALGVEYAQGYGIGRPVPIEQTALAGPPPILR